MKLFNVQLLNLKSKAIGHLHGTNQMLQCGRFPDETTFQEEDFAVCMYIGIEDLAANALIRILSQGKSISEGQKFIRFSVLLDYGMAVVKKLTTKGEEATLIYDRESNNMLFRDYSDFFERKTDAQGYAGIQLKGSIQVGDIVKRFIGQIPSSVQIVLSDNTILSRFFKAA